MSDPSATLAAWLACRLASSRLLSQVAPASNWVIPRIFLFPAHQTPSPPSPPPQRQISVVPSPSPLPLPSPHLPLPSRRSPSPSAASRLGCRSNHGQLYRARGTYTLFASRRNDIVVTSAHARRARRRPCAAALPLLSARVVLSNAQQHNLYNRKLPKKNYT